MHTDPANASPSGGCCGPSSSSSGGCDDGADVRGMVREKYGAVAEGKRGVAGCCSGPSDAAAVLAQVGYGAEDVASIPEGANLGLGCGNPVAFADLRPGETVLDLGSGGGIDCFLAAKGVGPTGRVIGVDMTPAMVERARATARRGGFQNVQFRLGEIESLPVANESVDAIVSNCVVNLSPDKPQVFREALRVLRPGGRVLLSDLVLTRPLSPELQRNVELYAGCISGAALKDDYLAMLRAAGFERIEVLSEGSYTVGSEGFAEGSPERDAFSAVASIKVRAVKPETSSCCGPDCC
jgi:SAM-dependent methyltransferase